MRFPESGNTLLFRKVLELPRRPAPPDERLQHFDGPLLLPFPPYFMTRSALALTRPQHGGRDYKLKPAEEVELKGATVRRVILTALALAMASFLITVCPSPGDGTSGPAVHAAGMSRSTSCVTVAGCLKDGLWTALTPLDSTKDSFGDSLSLPATQVVKCNVSCKGGDAISCPKEQ